MGARLEDYEKAAPYKSFLHVDQFSGPEQLAKFLHKLDQDDNLYIEYFKVSEISINSILRQRKLLNRIFNRTFSTIDF